MFLHVLEVFLGCFSRSACRERRTREHVSKPQSQTLKMEKIKTKSKNFFLGHISLFKKVHAIFLYVLEVFVGCFSRSACRERQRREHGGPSTEGASVFDHPQG